METRERDQMYSERQAQGCGEIFSRKTFYFLWQWSFVLFLLPLSFFADSPLYFFRFLFMITLELISGGEKKEEKRELALSKEKLSYYYHLSMNDNDNKHV